MHRDYHGSDRMWGSTSQAIDQAMSQFREAKVKFMDVDLSIDEQFYRRSYHRMGVISGLEHGDDHEWVRVVLTADPKLHLEDIEDPEPPRRKVHRRVPSTIAMEEVKVIVKNGDDCKQEHLAVQLIAHFYGLHSFD